MQDKPASKLPGEPDDPKMWLYFRALRAFRGLPRKVRDIIEFTVFGVAPDVPVVLSRGIPKARFWPVFTVGASSTFVLCFVVIGLWTWRAGTWSGSDEARLYFSNDWPNLVNYSLLCPLYVGLGLALMSSVLHGWESLRSFATSIGTARSRGSRLPLLLLTAFAILVISSAVTSAYVSETLNRNVYAKDYWFVTSVTESGERLFGTLGVYYSILNFWLLSVTLMTVIAFLSTFKMAVKVGVALGDGKVESIEGDEGLRRQLWCFTEVYIIAKMLAVVYMANAYTWVKEAEVGGFQIQESLNLVMMGAAISVIGVVVISLPRYYIEMQWFQLRLRMGADPKAARTDIRPFWVKFIANIADTFFIGSFILWFWWEIL